MKAQYTSNPAKTILTLCVGFIIVYFITHYIWALYVSLIIGIIGVLSNFLSQKIEWLWMKIAIVLGYIMPNIIMSLIYYVVLFPIALLSRIFKKTDSLILKNKYNSMWKERNKTFKKEDFENLW